jgi:hypothetical protein
MRACASERRVYAMLTTALRGAILCSSNTRRSMRLIEQQMCNAVINKNDWRKDNTEVLYSPSRDVCCVYLHKNLIATVDNNSVEIYDGGWQSNTTKSRLNAIINGLCDGYKCGVYQRKFEWFIMDNDETDIEFENGYTFARV